MNTYRCPYCRKLFTDPIDAYNCFRGHDVVYIMLTRSDIQNLIRFIYSGDMSLLTDSLVDSILSYSTYNKKDSD